MMFIILIAAIGLALSGLLVIAYGVLVQLSTGNALIIAGAIGFCSGMIMLGFWTTIRELRAISRKLASGVVAEARNAATAAAGDAVAATDLDPGFAAAEPPAGAGLFPPAAPPPWQDETVLRDHPIPDPLHPEPEPAPKKRNLLFSSTRRERARGGDALTPDLMAPELRSKPIQPAEPLSFDEDWNRPKRAEPPPRRNARTFPPAAPAGDADDQPSTTILKSGIVDGMAYSLYSDGSIEAQMPEGMMRFSSIDDLRVHLDQRS